MDFDAAAAGLIFGYLLVVARIGSALVFMPGFGETQVPMRPRLMLALVICAALYPATPVPTVFPGNPTDVAWMLGAEVTIGLWIGLVARILLAAMEFAGFQIGQVSGLANAFGPSLGSFEGATLVASLLLIATITLIFVTDTHHLILQALLYSYTAFPFGMVMLDDLASQAVRAAQHSIYIGTAIAAPFFVMSVVLNLGLGLANRMMPQLPVFLVGAPMLIAVGFFILLVATPAMMEFFLNDLANWLGDFQF
ncbi:flagellar biosynthetic protein FliR [Aestuariivita sp.]|uniref:flagellar biosynthetic protein FliR n=1 Tax=Aestuariivita sp. TaxID=1872407 RepID=UPI0025C5D766|nr:flagellar biosynthetic protein FliR [Aestuariivita sp.]